jgi:hypothetical protein
MSCSNALQDLGIKHRGPKNSLNDLRFDYGTLPTSVADFLRAQAHRIRRQATLSVIHIGKDLIAAKRYLRHGEFLNWISAEIGMPTRTAQAYMHVAEWASHKSPAVALLPSSILYILSTSSTPEYYVDKILRRVEAGERIVVSTIREELKELREKRRGDQTVGNGLPIQHRESKGQETRPTNTGSESELYQVVAILARELSIEDFARIRKILTSKSVPQNSKLAKKIKEALLGVDRSRCTTGALATAEQMVIHGSDCPKEVPSAGCGRPIGAVGGPGSS